MSTNLKDDMWKRLGASIAPRAFFCGFVLAVSACSFLGYYFSGLNHFKNFRRFHQPFGNYLRVVPTVSQMLSLTREPIEQNKKLVIVSGNSIAYGVRQGSDLWSKHLEEDLGPDFVVKNFAMEGMDGFTGPYLAFLSLARRYQNVFYVAVCDPLQYYPIDRRAFGSPFYYDALYKNILPVYPAIDKAVLERQASMSPAEKLVSQEERFSGRLDSLFYYQDFWTAVIYRIVFPDWVCGGLRNWLEKQPGYLDSDLPPLALEQRFSIFQDDWEKLRIKNKWKKYFLTERQGRISLPAYDQDEFERILQGLVPEELSSRILVVTVKDCPRYLKILSAPDKLNYEALHNINEQLLKKVGCKSITIGSDFSDNDYLDGCHLSPDGGIKMARAVAEQLMQMTKASERK